MPVIYIDGKRIETQNGKTIIQAAYENGIQVPHFCWHPELSVSGNCRMCLVQVGMPKRMPDGTIANDDHGNPIINFMPKLQIACGTPIADGMHVKLNNDKVTKTQEAVMEFLLINHPLDCPICDEAGQCKLQEYAFDHSKGASRFEETKNHKDKRVEWGPNVMYDGERCISCSRCIRFSKEIAKQEVLSFVQRGDHVTIKVADGAQFDNDYSMNVIDICPVGALTSKDFRFKSRVWDMSFNDSICTGCSRGCNTKLGVRNNEILRVEPATNMYVNKHWMCDHGRLAIHPNINQNRLIEPKIKNGNEQIVTDWATAISQAASALKKFSPDQIMFITSASASNETNYALAKFAKKVIKTNNIDFIRHENPAFADDMLKTSDMNANTLGSIMVGVEPANNAINATQLNEKIQSGKIKALYIVEEQDLSAETIALLDKLDLLIVHAFNETEISTKAHIALPASTFAESEGTFVNQAKRVQHFSPALVTKENRAKMGLKMSRLDKFGAANDAWTQHEQRSSRPSWKIITDLAKAFGFNMEYKTAEDVFHEITVSQQLFNGMNYSLLKKHQGVTLGKAASPDPVLVNYVSHDKKPN